jgi:hypothetical protein
VTVTIDTGEIPENIGTFQLNITGTSSDGVSHTTNIQVTVE